jgi:hypothetical protein
LTLERGIGEQFHGLEHRLHICRATPDRPRSCRPW